MVRTALYLRVSSRAQVEHGISLTDQLARLRAEARSAGETIVAEYVDQARSGASVTKRAEYQQLLVGARARTFDRVRFESVDRGHRNDFERRVFEAEMQRLGVQILYSGEPEKQAPQYRKFQRGLRGVVAELESDEASQRTYKRHLHRAKQGKWRGGQVPYGLQSDGHGWLEPDPESYPVLLWILERRAEGWGMHAIARALNQGIALRPGDAPAVPPTGTLLLYRRKPFLERQDPETGDVIRLPRRVPSGTWMAWAIRRMCAEVLDGIYAGILNWGRRQNRFVEDADGNAKAPVRVDTGRPLVPVELLHRVQVVEHAARSGRPATIALHNTFLLNLHCGRCGEACHGYTSTKYSNGKPYKYRKYRCAGRVNKPGACAMPMLSADLLETAVLEAVFADARRLSAGVLHGLLNDALERRRGELTAALRLVEQDLALCRERRESALDALADPSYSPALRAALIRRAEETVQAGDALDVQRRTLVAGLARLDDHARTISRTLLDPQLDPSRRQEPQVHQALKRALHLLIHRATLVEVARGSYVVELALYTLESLVRETGTHESALELVRTKPMRIGVAGLP
jgi:DNA invertase Pin-like site-specific DNA recombinase